MIRQLLRKLKYKICFEIDRQINMPNLVPMIFKWDIWQKESFSTTAKNIMKIELSVQKLFGIIHRNKFKRIVKAPACTARLLAWRGKHSRVNLNINVRDI